MRTVPAEVMELALTGVSVKIIAPIPLDEAGAINRALQLPADKIQNGMDVDFVAVFLGSVRWHATYDTILIDISVFGAGVKLEE